MLFRSHEEHGHDDHGHPAHPEPSFWTKYIFSSDHKVIGMQYGFCALMFMLFGFGLMLLMRWSIAHPMKAVPFLGSILHHICGSEMASPVKDAAGLITGYAITPELYNAFGAMHGTIMVFLGVVPLAFAAFGNYVVPLMIGAPDMTFPRINMASFHEIGRAHV